VEGLSDDCGSYHWRRSGGGKVVGHHLDHKRSVDMIRWTADDREKGGGVKIDRHVIHLSLWQSSQQRHVECCGRSHASCMTPCTIGRSL
jgi:hypothetical protein